MPLDARGEAWVAGQLARRAAFWAEMARRGVHVPGGRSQGRDGEPAAPGLSEADASALEGIRRRVLVDTMTARAEQDATALLREARRGRL